jgi:hypothetical protein
LLSGSKTDGNQSIFHRVATMQTTPPSLLRGQFLHLGFLATVVPTLLVLFSPGSGDWQGVAVSAWFCLALSIPILHQIYVLICWRLELRSQFLTSRWGFKRGFRIYTIGFFVLFSSRFLSLLLLAVADQASLPMSMSLRWALASPILLLAGYAMFSVKQYFGFERAAGIDHFDLTYRTKPMVRLGIFRWTKNAMYTFAIQSVWLFGILAASKLAIIAACFQSVYVWVHYFGTERPDMDYIYHRQPSAISRN